MQAKYTNLQPATRVSQKYEDLKPFIPTKMQLKNLQIDTDIGKPITNVFSHSTTHNRSHLSPNLPQPLTVKNGAENSTNPHHLNSPTHIIGKNTPLPNHEATKCSYKRNGIVKAYAANTNQGLVRNYNEDRVSIILNITNPNPTGRNKEEWPKCSFFGVYDGHGGVACADFLRDNLHQYVIKDENFPWKPVEALRSGFQKAERLFIENCLKLNEMNHSDGNIERSGSCCLVVLIVGDMCFVANVGDSRAIISSHSGIKVSSLSRDHKPVDENEKIRILEAGGKIYQSHGPSSKSTQVCLGPHRVFPGRLSVSRTFGDIEAKIASFGGNPRVVIAEPEIKVFKLLDEHEFIILASDGVYDRLNNNDIVKAGWDSLEESNALNIHQQCGLAVENILRTAINSKSLDNITVVMICFKGFKAKFKALKSKILKSTHISKNDKILNVNKNCSNIPVRDQRILNLLKGGSFVAALDSSNSNNENSFKRSLLEVGEYGKFHRNSVDEKKPQTTNIFDRDGSFTKVMGRFNELKKNQEKEHESNLSKLISKYNELKLQQNEKRDVLTSMGIMKRTQEKRD